MFHSLLAILLVEVPPILYRQLAVVAPPWQLELPMLLVLTYSFWNFTRPLTNSKLQAGHDVLSHTMVVSSIPIDERVRLIPAESSKKRIVHLIVALAIGALLWLGSVTQPSAVLTISSQRYAIEHSLPVRMYSVQENAERIFAQLLLVETKTSQEMRSLGVAFCQFFQDKSLLADSRALVVELIDVSSARLGRAPEYETVFLKAQSCQALTEEEITALTTNSSFFRPPAVERK